MTGDMGRDFGTGIEQIAGGLVSDEEGKMFDGGLDGNLHTGMGDSVMGEEYLCIKCGKVRPP